MKADPQELVSRCTEDVNTTRLPQHSWLHSFCFDSRSTPAADGQFLSSCSNMHTHTRTHTVLFSRHIVVRVCQILTATQPTLQALLCVHSCSDATEQSSKLRGCSHDYFPHNASVPRVRSGVAGFEAFIKGQ